MPVRRPMVPPRHRSARPVLAGVLIAACLAPTIAHAVDPGFIPLFTDPTRVFTIPQVPRPQALAPFRDPVFSTAVTRVPQDPGQPTVPVSGTWGSDARQVYSKQQPWNATGSLLTIENRAGGSPSPLLLDGESYRPFAAPCPGYAPYDYRWHPSTAHANEQINVTAAGTELMWWDVVNCVKTRSWTLPFAANYGIGSGEGNVSADGRFVVIADDTRMVVVDMDPQAPNAPPYPYRRIGPVYTLPPCSLDVAAPTACPIGNISISPSGRYIDVKYGGATGCDTTCDMHRIFEVDTSLAIRPHRMADDALRCGSFAARPDGWIFPLKHADMTRDPFDNDEDVIVGGRACPGSTLGRVVKVRLRDGRVTSLTTAGEAGYSHGSTRNLQRPGWVYVTYSADPAYAGRPLYGEVVAVKLDGSGAVERWGHYHSTASTYRSQAHAVPSPDGRRVFFASDWAVACDTLCGSTSVFQGYVLDARAGLDSIPPAAIRDVR